MDTLTVPFEQLSFSFSFTLFNLLFLSLKKKFLNTNLALMHIHFQKSCLGIFVTQRIECWGYP